MSQEARVMSQEFATPHTSYFILHTSTTEGSVYGKGV